MVQENTIKDSLAKLYAEVSDQLKKTSTCIELGTIQIDKQVDDILGLKEYYGIPIFVVRGIDKNIIWYCDNNGRSVRGIRIS